MIRAKQNKLTKIACLKWDFLRLNSDYIRDFADKCSTQDSLGDVHKFFKKQYGLNFPLDPQCDWSKAKLQAAFADTPALWFPSFSERFSSGFTHLLSSISPSEMNKARAKAVSDLDKIQLSDFDTINIQVNPAFSKPVVMDAVGQIYNQWRNESQRSGKRIRGRVRSKQNFAQYEILLRVYKMKKTNPNLTWRKLAAKLKRVPIREIQRSDEDRIAKQFHAAVKLVDGDYRKITL